MTRSRSNAILLAACAVLGLTLSGVALASAFSEPHRPLTGQLPPESDWREMQVKVTSYRYTNYDIPGKEGVPPAIKAAYGVTVTQSWTELDESGLVASYRNITTDSEGSILQDQRFDGNLETVNWYGWLDGSQNCSESHELQRRGGLLPRSEESRLVGNGFVAVDLPEGRNTPGWSAQLSAYERNQPGSPGFVAGRQVSLLDRSSGLLAGRYTYGSSADGSEVLIESEVRTVTIGPDAGEPPFSQETFMPCSAPRPSEN